MARVRVRGVRGRRTLRRVVGWRAHTTMRTDLVLDALEQALQVRETDLALLHHSVEGRNTC
jgi:transposase InsO family protein